MSACRISGVGEIAAIARFTCGGCAGAEEAAHVAGEAPAATRPPLAAESTRRAFVAVVLEDALARSRVAAPF